MLTKIVNFLRSYLAVEGEGELYELGRPHRQRGGRARAKGGEESS
jgi:hypothetical protein